MRTPRYIALLGLVCLPHASAGQALPVAFSGAAGFEAAVQEYRQIWASDGARITAVIQEVSGLTFPVDSVSVEVIDGPSWAGRSTMGMRATYPTATKRATLVHELGHILVGDLVPEDAAPGTAPTPHYLLFLFLYDVWVELWGEDFADEQVVVEGRRRGRVDYEGTWRAVLSNDRDARAAELREIIARYAG